MTPFTLDQKQWLLWHINENKDIVRYIDGRWTIDINFLEKILNGENVK